MKPVELTQGKLKELLHYQPDTGKFTWLCRRGGWANKGSSAGWKDAIGYIAIGINGKTYKAHRLAWLYMKGAFPDNQIDHINMDRTDNRFINLREATPSQQKFNMKKRSDNTTGVKGVVYHKRDKKYRAQTRFNGKSICIGSFKTLKEASEAYKQFAKTNHGVFYRENT